MDDSVEGPGSATKNRGSKTGEAWESGVVQLL